MLDGAQNCPGGRMGFGEAVATCFRKYATFRGRARRSEYWYFALFGILASIPAVILDKVFAPHEDRGPFSAVLSLVLFLPQISVTVRRLHDTGRSGWWYGGLFVYLIGATMLGMMVIFGPAGTGSKGPVAQIIVTALAFGAIAYFVWLFVLTVFDGTAGPNAYGPDPKEPAAT